MAFDDAFSPVDPGMVADNLYQYGAGGGPQTPPVDPGMVADRLFRKGAPRPPSPTPSVKTKDDDVAQYGTPIEDVSKYGTPVEPEKPKEEEKKKDDRWWFQKAAEDLGPEIVKSFKSGVEAINPFSEKHDQEIEARKKAMKEKGFLGSMGENISETLSRPGEALRAMQVNPAFAGAVGGTRAILGNALAAAPGGDLKLDANGNVVKMSPEEAIEAAKDKSELALGGFGHRGPRDNPLPPIGGAPPGAAPPPPGAGPGPQPGTPPPGAGPGPGAGTRPPGGGTPPPEGGQAGQARAEAAAEQHQDWEQARRTGRWSEYNRKWGPGGTRDNTPPPGAEAGTEAGADAGTAGWTKGDPGNGLYRATGRREGVLDDILRQYGFADGDLANMDMATKVQRATEGDRLNGAGHSADELRNMTPEQWEAALDKANKRGHHAKTPPGEEQEAPKSDYDKWKEWNDKQEEAKAKGQKPPPEPEPTPQAAPKEESPPGPMGGRDVHSTHDEVERKVAKAGLHPTEIDPLYVASAAEIVHNEGLSHEQAYVVAAARDAIKHGLITPEEIRSTQDAETAKAILEPPAISPRGVQPPAQSTPASGKAAPSRPGAQAQGPSRGGEAGKEIQQTGKPEDKQAPARTQSEEPVSNAPSSKSNAPGPAATRTTTSERPAISGQPTTSGQPATKAEPAKPATVAGKGPRAGREQPTRTSTNGKATTPPISAKTQPNLKVKERERPPEMKVELPPEENLPAPTGKQAEKIAKLKEKLARLQKNGPGYKSAIARLRRHIEALGGDAGLAPKVKKVRGKAAQKKPMSLLQFIASRGGISPNDKLIPDIQAIIGKKNYFVPGYGHLIMEGGPSVGQHHEAAVIEKYYFDEGRNKGTELTTSGHSTFLEHLEKEVRGKRVYKAGEEETPSDAIDRAKTQEEELAAASNDLDEFLKGAKVPLENVGPLDRKLAAEYMVEHGMGPEEALEAAVAHNERADGMVSPEDEAPWDLGDFDDIEPTAPKQGNVPPKESSKPAEGAKEAGVSAGRAAPSAGKDEGQGSSKPAGSGGAKTEPGVEGKPQFIIPGAEKDSDKERAKRLAGERLKPTVAQKPLDVGMFGDDSKQIDLMDIKPSVSEPVTPEAVNELADKIEATGAKEAKGFAGGMRSAAKAGVVKPESMQFYRDKLKEFEGQGGKVESVPKETFNLEDILLGDKEEVLSYRKILSTGQPPKVATALKKASDQFTATVTAINAAGFKVNDINSFNAIDKPDVRSNKNKMSSIGGMVSRLLKGLRKANGNENVPRVQGDLASLQNEINEPTQSSEPIVVSGPNLKEAEKAYHEAKAAHDKIKHKLDLDVARLEAPPQKPRNSLHKLNMEEARKTLERGVRSMLKREAVAMDALEDARKAYVAAQKAAKVVPPKVTPIEQPYAKVVEPPKPIAPEDLDIPEFLRRGPDAGKRDNPVNLKDEASLHIATDVLRKDYSPNQGEANNIQRGHATWYGMGITLEADKGDIRRGLTPNGTPYTVKMGAAYGYWKDYFGKDKDLNGNPQKVDVYVGPDLEGNYPAYVLNEVDRGTSKFRQTKTFVGFKSQKDALAAYTGTSSKSLANVRGMFAVSPSQLATWLENGDHSKPISQAEIQKANVKLPPGEVPYGVKEVRDAMLGAFKAKADAAERERQPEMKIETAPDDKSPMREEIVKAKTGFNAARMARIAGPKLYGDPTDLAAVSVKEMLQNSFDAVKDLIAEGKMTTGQIDIIVDHVQRTIRMTDNGKGMSTQIFSTKFWEVAGTHKTSDRASGGFGIAKLLYLFANGKIVVKTLQNGVLNEIETSGPELMASLGDKVIDDEMLDSIIATLPEEMQQQVRDAFKKAMDQAKGLDIRVSKVAADLWSGRGAKDAKELEIRKMFPDGHGTMVEVTIPEDYTDAAGEKHEIKFPSEKWDYPVLHNSPLFENIEVTFNEQPMYKMGKHFPINDYTRLWDIKSDKWGTARIYATVDANGQTYSGTKNMHVLSNGILQFSGKISSDPKDPLYGKAIPHTFYIDVSSSVKADDPAYPFDLNRQQFAKQAASDFGKMFSYITLMYQKADYENEVKNFGEFQYLEAKDLFGITPGPVQKLEPTIQAAETGFALLKKGDKLSIKDGQLMVGNRPIPELSIEDLRKAEINFDELTIPQDTLKSQSVMLHNNLEIKTDKDANGEDKWESLVDIARTRFGQRFDNYAHDMGQAFIALRNAVANVMDYPAMLKEVVGISFDQQYHGVSIRVPFHGSFLNIGLVRHPERASLAAMDLVGTMIHELAHHIIRNHGADFPQEMQNIQGAVDALVLELEDRINDRKPVNFSIDKFKRQVYDNIKQNLDILQWIDGKIKYARQNNDIRPRGRRFKEAGSYQAADDSVIRDVAGSQDTRGVRQGLSGGLEQSGDFVESESRLGKLLKLFEKGEPLEPINPIEQEIEDKGYYDLGQFRSLPDLPNAGQRAQGHVLALGEKFKREFLVGIDPHGNFTTNLMGNRNSVYFPKEFSVALKTPGNNIVTHHNHPDGTVFSRGDISLLGYPGHAAMWVHGNDGAVARISLTDRAKDLLYNLSPKEAAAELYNLADSVSRGLEAILGDAMIGGRIGLDEYMFYHLRQHVITSTLAEAGVLEYDHNIDPHVFDAGVAQSLVVPYIKMQAKFIQWSLFNDITDRANSDDRRARSYSHPGDLGVSFAKDASIATRRGSTRGNDPGSQKHGSPKTQVLHHFLRDDYEPRAETDFKQLVKDSKQWWARNYQPELVSDLALQAETHFGSYVAEKANEHDSWVAKLDDHWHFWSKQPLAAQMYFLNALEDPNVLLPPNMDAMRRYYKDLLDRNHAWEVQWGSKAAYIRDYFPHIWKKMGKARAWSDARTAQSGETWFQKSRFYDTIQEGIAAGLELRWTNPIDLLTHRLLSGADMRMKAQLLEKMQGMSLAYPYAMGGVHQVRRGWETINGPDRRNWIIAPDITALWKNAVEAKGLWHVENEWGSLFRGWMKFKNVWVPLKLAWSAFHPIHVAGLAAADGLAAAWDALVKGRDPALAFKRAMSALTDQFIAAPGASLGVVAGGWLGTTALHVGQYSGPVWGMLIGGIAGSVAMAALKKMGMPDVPHEGKRAIQAWKVRPEDRTPEEAEIVKRMTDGRFSPIRAEELTINAQRQFLTAWRKSEFHKAILPGFRRMVEVMQAPIFEVWIPAIKAKAYLDRTSDMVTRDPSLLGDDVRRMSMFQVVGRETDSRFGEMFYKGLFINAMHKTAAIASFLSFGWQYGFVNQYLMAPFHQIAKASQALGITNPSPIRRARRAAANKMPFIIIYAMLNGGIVNGTMNYMFTGEMPHGYDYIFARVGGVNPDGTPRRISNPSFLREIPMYIAHVAEEGGNYLNGALAMAKNKMAFSEVLNVWNNKTYWGYDIYDPESNMLKRQWDKLSYLFTEGIASPISKQGADRAVATGGSINKDVPLAYMGFGPAPAYVEKTNLQTHIARLYQRYGAPESKPAEERSMSTEKYRIRAQILNARKNGDEAALEKAYEDGRKIGLSTKYMHQIGKSDSYVYMFSHLPKTYQKLILEEANPQERAILLKHANKDVRKAWAEAHPDAPEPKAPTTPAPPIRAGVGSQPPSGPLKVTPPSNKTSPPPPLPRQLPSWLGGN